MIYLADSGLASSIVGPALAVVGTVAVAVLTTITTLRTSQRAATLQKEATALQKEQHLDARSDKEYERVLAQRDEAEEELERARASYDAMRQQRDEAIEELFRFKQRVWLAGYDPETIGREPGNDPRSRI